MAGLTGSVGQRGDNRATDVRRVQQLLNRRELALLAPLPEDGRVALETITAIRHFQTRYLHVSSPDGRVDPCGQTWRALQSGREHGRGESAETRAAERQLRHQYVDPRVKETSLTTKIIDRLLPHLARLRARIISGYLSDADLYWKVNYHWEYLLDTIDHCLALAIDDRVRNQLRSVRGQLLGCPPDPRSGYVTGAVGRPVDTSSQEYANKRHKILAQYKREFKKLFEGEGLLAKTRKSPTVFHLAVAPFAHPGTSKHSTGYALDIQGDNSAIKALCQGQGATLVFDEKSHVHVEFAHG